MSSPSRSYVDKGFACSAERPLLLAVVALGLSCVTTQLVLLRELLCAFAGNELVLGVVLGNWLLLMGVGTWLGRGSERLRDPHGNFLRIQILIAVVPLAQIFAVRALRNDVFVRGAAIGPGATIGASFLALLPYCLAAGFLLALACALHPCAARGASGAGRVYLADCVGSIIGGVLFGLVLVWVLNAFALLAAAGLLNLVATLWLAWRWGRKRMAWAALAGCAGLVVVAFVFKTDSFTTRLQHPGEEILYSGSSPYGQLVVTRGGGQLNFFQNGAPVVSTHSLEQIEETVHYAMAQRPEAQRVLLVGGGVSGCAKELLQYRAQVTCIELDPLFLELGRRFLPQNLADPRIRVVNGDGRRFVQASRAAFDVILMDLADPTTAQLNRFYTSEFLAAAKRALAPRGVLLLAVGRYENYVSPELGRILATVYRTLHGAFANILMLPGGRVFFLASDGPLVLEVADRLERAQIRTRFVNRHYMDAALSADRRADLWRAAAEPADTNRDFSPVLYFHCVRLWASQFESRFGFMAALATLALGIYLAWLRGPALTLFASGFTASALEVVLLLGLQAVCGALYYQLGIVVTVFMTGLAVGAAWGNRFHARALTGLAALAFGIAAIGLLLPLALNLLSRTVAAGGSPWIAPVVVGLLTLTLAVPVGAQFPLANALAFCNSNASAARLYTADFIGASVGALLASTLLIPWLGGRGLCLLATLLNALAGGVLIWKKIRT